MGGDPFLTRAFGVVRRKGGIDAQEDHEVSQEICDWLKFGYLIKDMGGWLSSPKGSRTSVENQFKLAS